MFVIITAYWLFLLVIAIGFLNKVKINTSQYSLTVIL